MKKKFLLLMFSLLLVCGCEQNKEVVINENDNTNVNGNIIQEKYLTNFSIVNLKKSSLALPPFTLKTTGIKNKTINSNSLSSLKVYDIISYKTKDFYTSKDEYIEVRNSGIKLIDVLSYLSIDEYSEITFIDKYDGEIKLPASKIDENAYLVFYENGEVLSEGQINLVIPAYVDIFWAEGIKEMKVTK